MITRAVAHLVLEVALDDVEACDGAAVQDVFDQASRTARGLILGSLAQCLGHRLRRSDVVGMEILLARQSATEIAPNKQGDDPPPGSVRPTAVTPRPRESTDVSRTLVQTDLPPEDE